jgi:nitrilase
MNPSKNISNIRIASIQMVSTPELQENLNTAARLIKVAAEEGAQLAVLPEYFCLMGLKDTDKVRARESYGNGPIQEQLSAIAKDNGIYLVAGTIPLEAGDPQKVLNTTLVFNPHGETIARYDKIHLFGFTRGTESYDESRGILAGDTICRVDTPVINLGLSICYDLRFPELYRELGEVDLILVPSAFTYTTGRAHWETLLRARAIENQCYVLAPAQGGTHENGRRTWGHSILIDPWGEVLSVLPEHEGVVSGTIDPARLAEVRQSLPALAHRKLFTQS